MFHLFLLFPQKIKRNKYNSLDHCSTAATVAVVCSRLNKYTASMFTNSGCFSITLEALQRPCAKSGDLFQSCVVRAAFQLSWEGGEQQQRPSTQTLRGLEPLVGKIRFHWWCSRDSLLLLREGIFDRIDLVEEASLCIRRLTASSGLSLGQGHAWIYTRLCTIHIYILFCLYV